MKQPFDDTSEYDYIKDDFKENYTKIYENLSKQISIKSAYHQEEDSVNSKLDPLLVRVAQIIEINFGINHNIVLEDFEIELKRRNINDSEIVPTFFTRFAIEEGSWIILLRNEIPELFNLKMQKLVDLEMRIWKDQIADPEEGIYYLLEMESISKYFISALFDYWMEDHNAKDYTISLEYILPSVLKIFSSKAEQVFEGSLRILKSKIIDLENTNNPDDPSEWRIQAINYLNKIDNDIKNSMGRYAHKETVFALVIQGILQSIIRRHIKSTPSVQKHISGDFDIISLLEWDDVTPEIDGQSYEEFQSNVYQLLLSFQNINPLEAAHQIFKAISQQPDEHLKSFTKIINESIIADGDPSYSQEYNEIFMVNEKLPKFLLQIKAVDIKYRDEDERREFEKQKQQEEIEDFKNLIRINIERTARITDPKSLKVEIEKFISSSIQNMIIKGYSSKASSAMILEVIAVVFHLKQDKIVDFHTKLENIYEKYELADHSQRLDKELEIELAIFLVQAIESQVIEN